MDFVILANAWSAAVDNPTSKHQIALELVRRGHRVLWIEGAGMRRPRMGAGLDRRRALRKIWCACRGVVREEVRCQVSGVRCQEPGVRSQGSRIRNQESEGSLHVLSPLTIPLPAQAWARRFNGRVVAGLARTWGERLGFHSPALINYVPVFAEVMRRWKDFKVYYCVDRWDAFGAYDSSLMTDMDRACCGSADLVIASSRDLFERCRQYNANTHRVTHGVDYAHFAKALQERTTPRDAGRADDGARTIGFFGLLSEWIDQDLLVRLAHELPQASIVLIGKADVNVARLRAMPNIRLPGAKPYEELPARVADFDVGIIPFVVNDLTRAVNPIKLREMLAAGCPVVSTALPEVGERQVSGVRFQVSGREGQAVAVARDADDFVRLVKERVVNPLSLQERQRISDSVKNETWENKVNEILALIGE